MGLTFSSKKATDSSLTGVGGAVEAIDLPDSKADESYRYLVLGFGTSAGYVAPAECCLFGGIFLRLLFSVESHS